MAGFGRGSAFLLSIVVDRNVGAIGLSFAKIPAMYSEDAAIRGLLLNHDRTCCRFIVAIESLPHRIAGTRGLLLRRCWKECADVRGLP